MILNLKNADGGEKEKSKGERKKTASKKEEKIGIFIFLFTLFFLSCSVIIEIS